MLRICGQIVAVGYLQLILVLTEGHSRPEESKRLDPIGVTTSYDLLYFNIVCFCFYRFYGIACIFSLIGNLGLQKLTIN